MPRVAPYLNLFQGQEETTELLGPIDVSGNGAATGLDRLSAGSQDWQA